MVGLPNRSQSVVLDAVAVKLSPESPDIKSSCSIGRSPPLAYVNINEPGWTVIACVAVTISVNGMVCVSVQDEMLTLPKYVPGIRPTGFTNTFTVVEVIPLVGLTNSQFPTLEAAALKVNWSPLLKVQRICGAGIVPPT